MSKVLITGGSGRLGVMLLEILHADTIGVFSRNANKQKLLRHRYPNVQFFEGDVTCYDDISHAMSGFDTVIHCAAMKDIAYCEANIEQCMHTNIQGTRTALCAAKMCGVEKFIYISTDMAPQAIGVYGHSKALAESLVVDAARDSSLKSYVIRFGNIISSKSSIFTFLREQALERGYVPITHPQMSRFIMSAKACAQHIIRVVMSTDLPYGVILVPRCPSYNILDVAHIAAPSVPIRIVGLRAGDALSVVMVSQSESPRTRLTDDWYIIYPLWAKQINGTQVDFESLTSENNPWRATIDELSKFI
ncbi:MAG: polysaccharide biosynthesis protein [Mucinivorans sp.]